MKLHRFLASFLVVGFGLASAALVAAPDEAAAPPAFLLSISHGIVEGHFNKDGQPMPATVDNVIGVVRDSFPNEMISEVGVGDVVIGDIVLEGQRSVPPAKSVFFALQEAAGGKLRSNDGDRTVILTRPNGGSETGRTIEVFNLTHYIYSGPPRGVFERVISEDQMRLDFLKHHSVPANSGHLDLDQIDRVSMDLEMQKAALARAVVSPDQLTQILDRLKGNITSILATYDPQSPAPEFSFHEGTNLLVVIGTPEAVAVASKVIGALQQGD